MNPSIINATSSMQAMQKRLDLISDNIANLNTIGYKRKEAAFADILTSVRRQHEDFELDGRRTPLGLTEDWGSWLVGAQLDLTQGSLQRTELETDLALEGNAMFEISALRLDEEGNPVLDEDGNPELDRFWTRDGSFRLTVQADDPANMYLTTQDGRIVRGIDDEPISIPRGDRIVVDEHGNITAYNDADPTAVPLQVGQLKLVRVIRPQLLESIGHNQYRLGGGLEDPEGVLEEIDLNFRDEETAAIRVRQGYVEQSNVDLSEEMTELIMTQRSLSFSARALTSADKLMELTNRLRG